MDLDGIEGPAVDVGLLATLGLLILSGAGEWLSIHPRVTLWLLAPLHLVMLPWMGFVLLAGLGEAEVTRRLQAHDPWNVEGWVGALYLCCGFMVPMFIGLTLVNTLPVAWFLVLIFGPYVGLALTIGVLLRNETRTGPTRPPPVTPWWVRWGTAMLTWAYLTSLEAALWVVRTTGDEVLSRGGLFFAVAILGLLPARLFLHRAWGQERGWHRVTLWIATAGLLLQLAMA